MAFTTKKLVIGNQEIQQSSDHIIPNSDELNPQELEFLLNILKNADLKGFQVEMFYNLVVKIQNQFLKKNK